MTRKIFILLDCPLHENDKKWIEDLYLEGYETILCAVDKRLSQLIRNGKLGRIKNYWLQLKQVWKVLLKSNKDDIIIVWYSVTGQIINLFARLFGGRNLILMNFLTPNNKGGVSKWMLRKTVSNVNNSILVNTKESVEQYKQLFLLKEGNCARFYYFPDVYDGERPFESPFYKEESKERYFFTGGMSNRDWSLLAEVARKHPTTRFICVALKTDFDQQIESVPSNMDVYYNLPSEEYYKVMRDAYCVLLPLKDNAVAGLINILKSIQFGVPCCISKTEATKQYYPKELDSLLVDHNSEAWSAVVGGFLKMSHDNYDAYVKIHQQFIQKEFSPSTALLRIKEVVNKAIITF